MKQHITNQLYNYIADRTDEQALAGLAQLTELCKLAKEWNCTTKEDILHLLANELSMIE